MTLAKHLDSRRYQPACHHVNSMVLGEGCGVVALQHKVLRKLPFSTNGLQATHQDLHQIVCTMGHRLIITDEKTNPVAMAQCCCYYLARTNICKPTPCPASTSNMCIKNQPTNATYIKILKQQKQHFLVKAPWLGGCVLQVHEEFCGRHTWGMPTAPFPWSLQ